MFLSSCTRLVALACLAGLAILRTGCAHADDLRHPGPLISAYVERDSARLPIDQVAHLCKGDRLLVTLDKAISADGKWLLVLATISPSGSKVTSRTFDLAKPGATPEIEIASDDAVPVMVMAPQVRTLFGLSTSFSQSAGLISDAIEADPQRFVELQKIDQINHAVKALSAGFDAAIQNQKPEHAVESSKALAAKFGVKNVDPECFKGNTVNTKCVAGNIVSNKDLTVPAAGELGALAGPFAAADLSAEMLANMRLFSAASTFLANKYRDQYDFAPSLGQRQGNSEAIQLFSSARFKNGNVKTAYVYVPSWFSGKPPELSIAGAAPACLSTGELGVRPTGNLPVSNYWRDWELSLREPGSKSVLARSNALVFKQEKGVFLLDFKKISQGLALNGQTLEASINGRFGFAHVATPSFPVVLPLADRAHDHVVGLDSLVAGEQARLHFAKPEGACIEALELLGGGASLAASTKDRRDELSVDLRSAPPGDATLRIAQYGMARQQLAVRIKERKAHVQRLVHHDLDTDMTVFGDNLERIASIHAAGAACLPAAPDPSTASLMSASMRVFSCPPELSNNARLPARATVTHQDQEPAAFDVAITKLGARPHMLVVGARAPIRTLMSAKAAQWGLAPDGQLVTEDSGLSLLLRAYGGYRLAPGSHRLQIRFADDPLTEQSPIAVSLIADRLHDELRTRTPISFPNIALPGIVNPIWYRVQNQQTGYAGDWLPLNRSVVTLPSLGAVSCAAGGKLLIHGSDLDRIDWVSHDLTRTAAPADSTQDDAPSAPCEKAQCLGVGRLAPDNRLRVKVHWIDERLFDVTFPDVPVCASAK